MDILAVALFIALVARFLVGAWKAQGRLSAHDRWALVTSFAVAATTFVIAPLLINWVVVPTAIWLIAVALLAGGVVGLVLRWPELIWFTGTRPIWRAMGVGATLVSCALMTLCVGA
jgi:hypothetical protein